MFEKIKLYIYKSNNFYSLLGNVVYGIFGLIIFVLMVRWLDRDIYGQWIIYITAISLLDMFRVGLTGIGAIRLISTSEGNNRKRNIGASYQLSMAFSFIISFLFIPAYFLLRNDFYDSYYLVVLLFYPFLSFANLPFNQANTLSQGLVKFKRIMLSKIINGTLCFVFIPGYIIIFEPRIEGIIISHIIANLLTSIPLMVLKWDGLECLFIWHKESVKKILEFGKYSTASFIGSNLLRSSDTIILSLSTAMGASAIAIYAIPLKFVELVEIPLRSFSATAFPRLSQAWKNNIKKFNYLLGQYLTITTILLFPLIVTMVFFSDLLLELIGGNQYHDTLEIQKQILLVISVYIFLLPLDRYSGVALFSINKPNINFYKILIMLLLNIIIDMIAVFVFKSLILVAISSVLFTIAGICIGWYYVVKKSGFSFLKAGIIIIHDIISIFVTLNSYYKKVTKNINIQYKSE